MLVADTQAEKIRCRLLPAFSSIGENSTIVNESWTKILFSGVAGPAGQVMKAVRDMALPFVR
jgi:hypothetical protein